MSVARTPMHRWKSLNSRLGNAAYFAFETVQSRLKSRRTWSVLVSNSKPSWETAIKRGFRNTPHDVALGELTPDTIKRYDVVVPLTIEDVKRLDELRDLVANNPIPIPSLKSILLCDDKWAFNQTLIANGFGHLVPSMGTGLGYPYIIKKRMDSGGLNSHIVHDAEQERGLAALLTNDEYFAQDFVVGAKEYVTHAVFKDGAFLCALNMEYYLGSDAPIVFRKGAGGDTPVYRKICRSPYLEEFSAILRTIGFSGLCCINYKVRDGRLLILEINPRFGGSLCSYLFSFMRHLPAPASK